MQECLPQGYVQSAFCSWAGTDTGIAGNAGQYTLLEIAMLQTSGKQAPVEEM